MSRGSISPHFVPPCCRVVVHFVLSYRVTAATSHYRCAIVAAVSAPPPCCRTTAASSHYRRAATPQTFRHTAAVLALPPRHRVTVIPRCRRAIAPLLRPRTTVIPHHRHFAVASCGFVSLRNPMPCSGAPSREARPHAGAARREAFPSSSLRVLRYASCIFANCRMVT